MPPPPPLLWHEAAVMLITPRCHHTPPSHHTPSPFSVTPTPRHEHTNTTRVKHKALRRRTGLGIEGFSFFLFLLTTYMIRLPHHHPTSCWLTHPTPSTRHPSPQLPSRRTRRTHPWGRVLHVWWLPHATPHDKHKKHALGACFLCLSSSSSCAPRQTRKTCPFGHFYVLVVVLTHHSRPTHPCRLRLTWTRKTCCKTCFCCLWLPPPHSQLPNTRNMPLWARSWCSAASSPHLTLNTRNTPQEQLPHPPSRRTEKTRPYEHVFTVRRPFHPDTRNVTKCRVSGVRWLPLTPSYVEHQEQALSSTASSPHPSTVPLPPQHPKRDIWLHFRCSLAPPHPPPLCRTASSPYPSRRTPKTRPLGCVFHV